MNSLLEATSWSFLLPYLWPSFLESFAKFRSIETFARNRAQCRENIQVFRWCCLQKHFASANACTGFWYVKWHRADSDIFPVSLRRLPTSCSQPYFHANPKCWRFQRENFEHATRRTRGAQVWKWVRVDSRNSCLHCEMWCKSISSNFSSDAFRHEWKNMGFGALAEWPCKDTEDDKE